MNQSEKEFLLQQCNEANQKLREAQEYTKTLQDMAGYNPKYSDQQATGNMAEKATYDQFELYLGIATAQQIALEQMKERGMEQRDEILTSLQSMADLTSPHGQAVNAIREQMVIANDHLSNIRNYNKDMLRYMNEQLSDRMDKMYDLIDERL